MNQSSQSSLSVCLVPAVASPVVATKVLEIDDANRLVHVNPAAVEEQAVARIADPSNATDPRWHRVLAAAQHVLGKHAAAGLRAAHAVVLASRSGDESSYRSALLLLGACEMCLGEYEKAADHLGEVVSLSAAKGDELLLRKALNNLGLVLLAAGRPEDALAVFSQVLRLDAGPPDSMAVLHNNLGVCEEKRGKLPSAQAGFERAIAIAIEAGLDSHLVRYEINLARCDWQLGRTQPALSSARRTLARARDLRLQQDEARATLLIGRIAAGLGDLDEACAMLWRTVEATHVVHGSEERIAALEALVAVARQRNDAIELARVSTVMLDLFLQERQAAAKRRAAGLRIRELMAENMLGAIRARRPPTTPGAPEDPVRIVFGLSAAEDRVLGELVRGRQNKQIAAQLSLSTYTVRHHVSAILSKMRVGSRTEAVALALKLRSGAQRPVATC